MATWQQDAQSYLGAQAPAVIKFLSGIDPNYDWKYALWKTATDLNAAGEGWQDPLRGSSAAIANQVLGTAQTHDPAAPQSRSLNDNLNALAQGQNATIQAEQATHGAKGLLGGLGPLAQIAALIPGPQQPFLLAANAANSLSQGNLIGAGLNAFGAYSGGWDGLSGGGSELTAANGGIDQGALGQILGTNNPAVIPPGWEYTAKAASNVTPTAMQDAIQVHPVTDGVLPSTTSNSLANIPENVLNTSADAFDAGVGSDALNYSGQTYQQFLNSLPGAAAVGGLAGAAGAAAASGGGAAAGGATGTGLTLGNAASGASLAATAAAAGSGGPATDQQLNDAINGAVESDPATNAQLNDAINGSGAPTPSYEDVIGAGGVSNGETLTSEFGGSSDISGAGALSSIAKWAKDNPTLLKALGTGAGGIWGYLQSNRQAAQLKSLADQYAGYGAPSRARYEATFQPGFTMASDPGYTDALNQASKATLHSLSVNGNPAGSPNAWAQSLADNTAKFAYPALQTYRSQNANSGGISTFNAASPELATGAITAQGQGTNSLGKAAANIFSPAQPTSLADILKLYGQGSGNIFGAAV